MAIASSIDIVLENDDIVVLGPPTSIDIAVDIGPEGPRGSRTFTGAADPNTYTTSQFEIIYGNVPVYGDIFIRTSSGSDYGLFYMYNTLAIGGPIWQEILRVYDLLTNFFTVNDTFVLSGKNGGTGAANTGKSLLLGGPQTIFNGNNTVTITSTGNTNVTLPTSGTLATTGSLSQFASTTSAQLAGIISDETGTGSLVFATSPTLAGIPLSTTAAVDTNTTQIATTAFVINQGYLKSSDASSTYAPLLSPNLSGTPLSTTASVDTNTTQIATTAFVLGQASGVNPQALGSVAIGSSTRYARADHVHPTTGLALLSGATFTGSIIAPASTTSISPINIPHGVSPTSPADGDIWTTSTGMYIRINGSTIGPLGTGGGGGGGGTTNTEDVIGISFFTMGA